MKQSSLCLWLCLTVMATVTGRARASDLTSELEQHFRALGAIETRVVQRGFLFEGAAQALNQVTSHAGCVGFLVIGVGEVRDVDISLYTPGGLALDEDVAVAPYGYVRACTAAEVPLVIGTTLYAGRGELTILRVENAPRELGRLPGSIALAVMPGGRSEEPQALGTPPDEGDMSTVIASEEALLSERGYVATGAPEVVDLQGGQGEALVLLSGQSCVRIVAHAPGVRGLTLQIEGPADGRALARSPNRDSVELLFCPREAGVHRVRGRARSMRALLLLRVFEHPLARADQADAELALGSAEITHQWLQHGFVAHALGDAWVEAREPTRYLVDLSVGQCYGLAAVSAEGTTLDLRLIDPEERILSRTDGRNGVPMLYACPAVSGRYTLLLTSRSRDQRVSVWLSGSRGQEGVAP